MKKLKLFLLLFSFLFCIYSFKSDRPKFTIFIAGDSTAQTYDERKDGLIKGWGQMLPMYFSDEVRIDNRAIGGRSTKSFIAEGRWDKLCRDLKKGDYVLIQFGHNDASTKPERHTSYMEYKKNLVKFIDDVRARDATPILLTSIVMRTFQRGNLIDDRLKGYPVIMREVAREYKVPCVDVNLITHDFVTLLGDSASIPYYRHVAPGVDPVHPQGLNDDTHMMEEGAKKVASFIAEGIKELKINGLSEYVK